MPRARTTDLDNDKGEATACAAVKAADIRSSMRPHCQNLDACVAKTADKHCNRCTMQIPEVAERRRAAVKAAMQRPEVRAAKVAHCRALAADPEINKRRQAAMMATHARPEVKKRHREACQQATDRRMAKPGERERMRRQGIQYGLPNFAAGSEPESIAKRGPKIKAHHLAWCPPRFWPLNELLKRKGFKLDERKAMIAEEAERDTSSQARREIERITAEMRARQARERAQAY